MRRSSARCRRSCVHPNPNPSPNPKPNPNLNPSPNPSPNPNPNQAAEAEAEAEKGNAIERLLGSLATPAVEAQSEGGGDGFFGVRSP